MSSPDIGLLALFTTKEKYERYGKMVRTDALMVAETNVVLDDYKAYYETFPKHTQIDFDTFRTFARVVRHSGWKREKHEAYEAILTRVEEASKETQDDAVLGYFVRLEAAEKITEHCQRLAQGKSDDLTPIIHIAERASKESNVASDVSDMFGTTDLTSILDKSVRHGGIEWRLECMNQAAGPLHQGDLVIVTARPEAGKTSFICSELTHMVKFLSEDKEAVLFNPEEGGGRLFLRLLTAATGLDIVTIAGDEDAAKRAYELEVGRLDRIKVVEPAGGISTRDVERVLDTGKFGLVAINVLDKIKTPFRAKDEKDVDRYRALAYWMREAANRYEVPIIAVAQADAAAEGQKYLTQSMLYGSKTGVQGEADLLIGMGLDPTIDDRRWISLLKNKLPGGPKTLPTLKHAKLEVRFNPTTGRFSDL
jgi:replicative DNA helicase